MSIDDKFNLKDRLDKDKICVWKDLANDPESTTFQHLRKVKDSSHPLYKCMYECGGTFQERECYHSLTNPNYDGWKQ